MKLVNNQYQNTSLEFNFEGTWYSVHVCQGPEKDSVYWFKHILLVNTKGLGVAKLT